MIVPANGDGTSIVALSVITSMSPWPRLTASPGLTSQRDQLGLVDAFAEFGQFEIHGITPLTLGVRVRRFGRHRASLLHVRQLRHGVLLVDLVQPDARHVLAQQHPRPDQQVVEMLVDDAPQQVLAEVGHLGVLVDDQHPARLQHALR